MADQFDADETMELEFSEEDIAYFIVDEDDNEIGIALYDDDGNEVEFYYADDFDPDEFELVADEDSENAEDGDAFEIEVSEDDIAYFIVDEQGNEIGFALTDEDGTETEYYYEGVDAEDYADADAVEVFTDSDYAEPTVVTEEDCLDPEALAIAQEAFDSAQNAKALQAKKNQPFAKRAGYEVGKLTTIAGTQAGKAAATAKDTFKRIKEDAKKPAEEKDEDLGFGLTANGVKKAAGEFSTMAKDGAQAAAELKEVYNDIAESLDFLGIKPGPRTGRR